MNEILQYIKRHHPDAYQALTQGEDVDIRGLLPASWEPGEDPERSRRREAFEQSTPGQQMGKLFEDRIDYGAMIEDQGEDDPLRHLRSFARQVRDKAWEALSRVPVVNPATGGSMGMNMAEGAQLAGEMLVPQNEAEWGLELLTGPIPSTAMAGVFGRIARNAPVDELARIARQMPDDVRWRSTVVADDGEVFTGLNHYEALQEARAAGYTKEQLPNLNLEPNSERFGFQAYTGGSRSPFNKGAPEEVLIEHAPRGESTRVLEELDQLTEKTRTLGTDAEGRSVAVSENVSDAPGPKRARPVNVDRAFLDAWDGGATVDARTGERVTEGWAAAPSKATEETFDHMPTEAEVRAYRERHADLLDSDRAALGGWETEDGRYVLDVSHVYARRQDAVRTGAIGEQESIANLGAIEAGDWDNAFHTITPDERISARRSQYQGASGRARLDEEIKQGLSPEEARYFDETDKGTRQDIRDVYLASPTPRSMASMAAEGRGMRGWYEVAGADAGALAETFGEDAPRFAALLAALSPQVPVERNMDLALEAWGRWTRAGRPDDPDAIRKLFPTRMTSGKNPKPYNVPEGAIPTVENGMLRSLSATNDELLDPDVIDHVLPPKQDRGQFLSGVKVNNFYANLMGNTQRLTLDTHMFTGAGGRNTATIARQLGYGSAARQGAEELGRLTGQTIDPREMQEMMWSFIRPLREATGSSVTASPRMRQLRSVMDSPTAEQVLRGQAQGATRPAAPLIDETLDKPQRGLGLHDRRADIGVIPDDPMGVVREEVASVPTFASLLQEPARGERLLEMGYRLPEIQPQRGWPEGADALALRLPDGTVIPGTAEDALHIDIVDRNREQLADLFRQRVGREPRPDELMDYVAGDAGGYMVGDRFVPRSEAAETLGGRMSSTVMSKGGESVRSVPRPVDLIDWAQRIDIGRAAKQGKRPYLFGLTGAGLLGGGAAAQQQQRGLLPIGLRDERERRRQLLGM